MTATLTDPVVEEQVLTALDFDTPPVEVTSSTVTVMGGSSIVYTMPPGAVLTITADNVEWSVAEGEFKFEMAEVQQPKPVTFEMLSKAYITWKPSQCGCGLCQPEHAGTMDPTAKALWVEALRDPSRKQGRGALYRDGLWCALGVLIDVAMKAGVPVSTRLDTSGATLFDGQGGVLPVSVREWAGLRGSPGVDGVAVAALNDMGTPFARIADRIEACL